MDRRGAKVTSLQQPLDSLMPPTSVERIFSREGVRIRMVCQEVVATQEFIRCIQDN